MDIKKIVSNILARNLEFWISLWCTGLVIGLLDLDGLTGIIPVITLALLLTFIFYFLQKRLFQFSFGDYFFDLNSDSDQHAGKIVVIKYTTGLVITIYLIVLAFC